MTVTTTTAAESPNRTLVFRTSEPVETIEMRDKVWAFADLWIETRFRGQNRSSGGIQINPKTFIVTLRFEQYDRMPALDERL